MHSATILVAADQILTVSLFVIILFVVIRGVEKQPVTKSPAHPGIAVRAEHSTTQQKPLVYNDI